MGAVLIIPIKSFELAKGRLSESLGAQERSDLAREMATTVIGARGDLPAFVVCDDPDVASFSVERGAGVIWRPSAGLNAAAADGMRFARSEGYERVVLAHADLPLAKELNRFGQPQASNRVTIVPDRRDDGTNVISIPTATDFTFYYGPGSAAAHRQECQRLGLEVAVCNDELLGWDVDVPEDLPVFQRVTAQKENQ